MKFKVPQRISHVSLDGELYPVREGVVEIPEAAVGPDISRVGYEPLSDAPPPKAKAKRSK